MTVVAAIKLQDLRAASKATCQTHSRHGGLRTGVDQANLFRSGTGNNFFRQQGLPDGRSTEAQAILSYFLHSLNDVRVCIAVNHRAIRADQVNKGVAVDIRELRALCRGNHARLPTDGTKGTYGGIHTAWGDLSGAGKPLRRSRSLRRIQGVRGRSHSPHCTYFAAIQKFE